jgi:hypothetical protein
MNNNSTTFTDAILASMEGELKTQTCPEKPLVDDLKMQILSELPGAMNQQKSCPIQGGDIYCRLNSKLLQYFLHQEFLQKEDTPAAEATVEAPKPFEHEFVAPTPKEMVAEGQQALEQLNNASDPSAVEKQMTSTKQNVGNSMKITKCPHVHRKHYAKNMCSSCYRKFGRNQLAWNCEHTDRLNYSIGMCQTCYLSDYHKRRTKAKAKAAAKTTDSCELISNSSLERINEEINQEQTCANAKF